MNIITPKEKAKELFYKMKLCLFSDGYYDAKQCSLIAVDEVIILQNQYNHGSINPSNYWNEVKNEIEKL